MFLLWDNCPAVGIRLLLQFPHPPGAGPVLLTLLFFPLVPLSYWVLHVYIYSFEEGNGTPSSTLAWKIPWTKKPGGLRSMGSLRVGHDWATSLSLFTCMHWRRQWQPTPVFLPWRIPGTGEPGGLPSMGSHKVGYDWSDLAEAYILFRSGPPVHSQLVFCMHVCVWRCIPDGSMERDVLHVHLLLCHLVLP